MTKHTTREGVGITLSAFDATHYVCSVCAAPRGQRCHSRSGIPHASRIDKVVVAVRRAQWGTDHPALIVFPVSFELWRTRQGEREHGRGFDVLAAWDDMTTKAMQ